MLCQFTVKNYKSIRDEVTFDMQATSISEHKDKIIIHKNQPLLPVSVIYGPNGGGKSNTLEAFHALTTKVLRPIYVTDDNPAYLLLNKRKLIQPFLFSEETKELPTEFQLFFRTELAEYKYELHIKDDVVIYESLSRIKFDTNRKSLLFIRKKNEISLKGDFSKFRISNELSDTLPLLSYIGMTYKKNAIVEDVFKWLEYKIKFLNYGSPAQELSIAISNSEQVKNLMLKMMQEMDLDIKGFRVVKEENNTINVYTLHSVNSSESELNLSDESSGTRKLFGIMPFIAHSLLYGATLIIDELDAKIHPTLLAYIIRLFTDMNINKKNSQLIFTSHDLSTMNSETFRRDEIWFVAKGEEQNSTLYSLVEFKPNGSKSIRKDSRFDKQYLEGRYGADPYFKKIINWEDVNV